MLGVRARGKSRFRCGLFREILFGSLVLFAESKPDIFGEMGKTQLLSKAVRLSVKLLSEYKHHFLHRRVTTLKLNNKIVLSIYIGFQYVKYGSIFKNKAEIVF